MDSNHHQLAAVTKTQNGEDNKRAIHLYEKFGFEREGLKRFAAIRKGKYENEYLMARINPTDTKQT